jgi:hypothetical protein
MDSDSDMYRRVVEIRKAFTDELIQVLQEQYNLAQNQRDNPNAMFPFDYYEGLLDGYDNTRHYIAMLTGLTYDPLDGSI